MIGIVIVGKKPYDDTNHPLLCGKVRKLSITCQLTDGSEYEGGELEFDFRNYEPNKREEKKTRSSSKRNIN